MKTAARTNNPSAKKLKAVPVFVKTDVRELDNALKVMLGIDLSILATTTSPTIIVTAAITTVRIRETMSIAPFSFLNITHTPPHRLM
jgi:hypothetical protein